MTDKKTYSEDPARASLVFTGLFPRSFSQSPPLSAVRDFFLQDDYLEVIPLDRPGSDEPRLAAALSEAERRRADRFLRPRDRRRYLLAHARVRELLAERLGIRPDEVELDCSPYGKPELRGLQAESGWHFNLSYSGGTDGGMAVCALSCRGPVGVDVESVRPIEDGDRLARLFFSPREYATYLRLPPGDRLRGFFNCWTRKEALVKAWGCGLSHDPADFDVTLAPGSPARILRLGGAFGEGGDWQLVSFDLPGDRVAALAFQRS